jgi:hypothetical protein
LRCLRSNYYGRIAARGCKLDARHRARKPRMSGLDEVRSGKSSLFAKELHGGFSAQARRLIPCFGTIVFGPRMEPWPRRQENFSRNSYTTSRGGLKRLARSRIAPKIRAHGE